MYSIAYTWHDLHTFYVRDGEDEAALRVQMVMLSAAVMEQMIPFGEFSTTGNSYSYGWKAARAWLIRHKDADAAVLPL